MKVLICGLGRMGNIHKKYLEQLGVDWIFFDPFVNRPEISSRKINTLKQTIDELVTHVIISSTEDVHYNNYISLRSLGFSGPVLVEKPAVVERQHFSIFDDKKVSVGLVERFNPAIEVLRENIKAGEVVSSDFTRCSVASASNQKVNSFIDVGIHDVDLYFYLFGDRNPNCSFENFSNTFTLTLREPDKFISRFIWSNETSCKERKIIIRHKSFTLEAELINQIVTKTLATDNGKMITQNLYVEKASPVLKQLSRFLERGRTSTGQRSHELYFQLREKYNV